MVQDASRPDVGNQMINLPLTECSSAEEMMESDIPEAHWAIFQGKTLDLITCWLTLAFNYFQANITVSLHPVCF